MMIRQKYFRPAKAAFLWIAAVLFPSMLMINELLHTSIPHTGTLTNMQAVPGAPAPVWPVTISNTRYTWVKV